jgi:arginyl-tRNA synthetase
MFEPLTAKVNAIIRNAFAALGLPIDQARALPCSRPEIADFQCNGVMSAGQGRSSRVTCPRPSHRGPSFRRSGLCGGLGGRTALHQLINLWIAPEMLASTAAVMAADERLGIADEGKGRLAVIDFGGPNVAKHVARQATAAD